MKKKMLADAERDSYNRRNRSRIGLLECGESAPLCLSFEQSRGAGAFDSASKQNKAARTYLERDALYKMYDQESGNSYPFEPENIEVMNTSLPIFLCPSDPNQLVQGTGGCHNC